MTSTTSTVIQKTLINAIAWRSWRAIHKVLYRVFFYKKFALKGVFRYDLHDLHTSFRNTDQSYSVTVVTGIT